MLKSKHKMLTLNTDLFFYQIEYLSFSDVINLCSSCKIFHEYGIDLKYNLRWKFLSDKTYSFIYDYYSKLSTFPTINYLTYCNLIKLTDNVTKCMIYYRNDPRSFESMNLKERFLALFLLNKKEIIVQLPISKDYGTYIRILFNKKISQTSVDNIFINMATFGSVIGMIKILDYGANFPQIGIYAMQRAVQNGHLEVVKYLHNHNINIDNNIMLNACEHGHLHIVKYLHTNGVNIDNYDLIISCKGGHLGVVKYLLDNGNIKYLTNNFNVDSTLIIASEKGHLDLIKYLLTKGPFSQSEIDYSVQDALKNKHTEIVKILLDHGADHSKAIRQAAKYDNLEIVQHLIEKVYHIDKDAIFLIASRNNYPEIVNFIMDYSNKNNEFIPIRNKSCNIF